MCKIKMFDPDGWLNPKFIEYTCVEVRELFPLWKEKFKKVNRCEDNDQYYMDYCEEISQFLGGCKCTQ